MMKRALVNEMEKKARLFFERAGIIVREDEAVEVSDFGLDNIHNVGLQLCVYINTDRVCAKEMVLFPHQTCPEHKHVGDGENLGKEETFRCRYGKVYLYVEGEGDEKNINGILPDTDTTVYKEIVLNPGEQYTIMPNTLHWFQAADEGAVISEFSTKSTDETDVFTDINIIRQTIIED